MHRLCTECSYRYSIAPVGVCSGGGSTELCVRVVVMMVGVVVVVMVVMGVVVEVVSCEGVEGSLGDGPDGGS